MSAIDSLQKFPRSILNRGTIPAPEIHDDKPSYLGKFWKIIAAEFDEIEVQFQAIKDLEHIYLATGVNLDQLGSLVNETREPGYDDDTYRLFILIAISKRLAKGTLPEIIEIGKNVAGLETGAVFIPKEFYLDSEMYLDDSALLDGNDPLDPDEKRPASFVLEIEGEIDYLRVPTLLAKAVDLIRPAGVYAKTKIRFLFLDSKEGARTKRTSTWDGTGTFDGLTYWTPQANYVVDEVAIGNGGNVIPPPSSGQLSNELLRKAALIKLLPDGTKEYSINIDFTESNGVNINEIVFLNSASNTPIFKDIFPDKPKNSTLIYDFKLREVPL